MNTQEATKLRLLLDTPEKEAIFGFDEYASILTSVITETDPHFTIGIFGKWGSGKTTLLKRIERYISSSSSNKILPVFFNAWRYQHEEHMLLPILNTLSQHLKREETNWQGLHDKVKPLLTSVASAITLKLPVLELHGDKGIEKWQSAREMKSSYFNWFTKLQEALDDARRNDLNRRIVIMIDDLDRCLPHKIIEVLESIKVMLDISGFIFVLALDEQVVEHAILNHYGHDYAISGRDYIKKLVQVEFRLPPIRTQDVTNYTQLLQQRIGQVDEQISTALAQAVPMVAGHNPREVKRFINSALLATSIMESVGVKVPAGHQIAYMALEFRWPGIARTLAIDESLRKQIKEYVEAEMQGKITSLVKKEIEHIEEIMENNLDLDSFLKQDLGKDLLDLSETSFNELVYYTSITTEKKQIEVTEDLIYETLSTLTPREQRVLQLRFGLEDGRSRTLEEVGKEFKVTRERIRQIEAKAFRKMRHPSRSRKLRNLLSSMDELDISSQNILLAIFGADWQQ